MKRKVLVMILSLVTCIGITGCGEKKTVGDNLIHEDPTAYSSDVMEIAGMTADNNIEDDESAYQPENGEETSEDNTEENAGENVGENTEDNNEVNPEENMQDISEDGSEQANVEDGEASELEESGENTEATDEENPDVQENSVDSANVETDNNLTDIMVIDNNIIEFSNISGQDIDKLYITFNPGNINSLEVLGVSDLKNGFGFKYGITDMETLKSAGIVNMSITAKTVKGDDLDFGSMEVIDVTDISVVLSKNSTGYYMYLE